MPARIQQPLPCITRTPPRQTLSVGDLPTEVLFHLTEQHPEAAVKLAMTSADLTQRSVLCALFRHFRSSITDMCRFISHSRWAGHTPAQIVALAKALGQSRERREHPETLLSLGLLSPRELSACCPMLAALLAQTEVMLYLFTSRGALLQKCLDFPLDWHEVPDPSYQLDREYMKKECRAMLWLLREMFGAKSSAPGRPTRDIHTLAQLVSEQQRCGEALLARAGAEDDAALRDRARDMLKVHFHLLQCLPRDLARRCKDGPVFMFVFTELAGTWNRPHNASSGTCAVL